MSGSVANKAIRNLLVTRFSALGDVAMTVPVLYSVCESNPQIRFVMLTKAGAATAIFLNPPSNLEVVGVDLKKYDGPSGLYRLYRELRKRYDIDAYADLHDVLRTKVLRLLFRLGGATVCKIHKGRRGRRALTRRRNKIMLPLPTSRARYREVFWRIGLNREDTFDSLFTASSPASPQLYAAATPPRAEGETWVAIAPFARHAGKIYPLHLMRQVVEEIAARRGWKIFLLGAGDKEREILQEWHRISPANIVNMAALNLGIEVELHLLSHCNVLISMDSANMHLASLVGTRVVSVWGATHPYCGFMGWRQKKGDAVQLDMTCRPCSIFGNKPCVRGDMHCMYGIQPAYIISKLDHALSRR